MPEKSGPEYKSCESCHERINKYEEELRDNLTMEDLLYSLWRGAGI